MKFISSTLTRQDELNEKGVKVNNHLHSNCRNYLQKYIDNSKIITSRHLNQSGLHLNKDGTKALSEHFVKGINDWETVCVCDVFVESEDMEFEFTEILYLDGCSESGLDLDSDRDVNLSMNLDINYTVFLHSFNVLKDSPGQMESEKPNVVLSELRANNSERLIIAQININGIDHKFQSLVSIIKNKVDIIMISETKVDDSYPISQFQIEGYSSPFRLDRDSHGGGKMIYFPDYLPCKRIESFLLPNNAEVMFIEMNIRKSKWLVISGCNPRNENICPLVCVFHNRTINTKINGLHERALRIVYKDKTDDNLSFQDLDKDRAFKIRDRNYLRLAVEMYKVKNNIPIAYARTFY